MSNTREFRKNPTQGLKMYSNFFLPMKNFMEGQIAKLNLDVDIDQLYPINDAWAHFCTEPIANINRRKIRMKRKAAPDGHLKRPMSGFMWFINESRAEFVKKNPTAKLTEITKELSKQWNALSDKDKEVYVEKFNADKERFAKERKEILDKVSEEDRDYKDSKPKKAINAYVFFMKDESIREKLRSEHQKLIAEGVNKSWMQFIPTIWEKMSPTEKEKYEKLAEDDVKRFQKEMVEYNEKFKNHTEQQQTA
jgi:hypothetical protein